ncbi:MAG: hemerythrin domain-containing protein [Bacteroidota bacterium]
MISKKMPMGHALLEHNRLLPLFARFNIRLGFGEQSVEEVCQSHGVNTDFFLEIANAYLDEGFVPPDELSGFSLESMVEYLKATHSYYIEVALPGIEDKILRLLDRSELSKNEINLVTGFFNDYKQEFLAHISHEEKEILPYIVELEKQSLKPRPGPRFIERLKEYSIGEFAKEHDRLENSLENLSKLIIKYLPPFEDQELCIRVLRDLDELVEDLIDHADMEDKVLVPRVAELEKMVIQKAGTS